jgi:hypothetical protein
MFRDDAWRKYKRIFWGKSLHSKMKMKRIGKAVWEREDNLKKKIIIKCKNLKT